MKFFSARGGLVDEILYTGSIKMQKIARETIIEVRKAMGLTGVWNRISRRAEKYRKAAASGKAAQAAQVVKKREPLRAAIFDMDGTLVDSEPIWKLSDEAWLKKHGVVLTKEQWPHFLGKGGRNFVQELLNEGMLTGDHEELRREKDLMYTEFSRNRIKLFPEMLATVEQLRARGLKTAIASSSSAAIIQATMETSAKNIFLIFFAQATRWNRVNPIPCFFPHSQTARGKSRTLSGH